MAIANPQNKYAAENHRQTIEKLKDKVNIPMILVGFESIGEVTDPTTQKTFNAVTILVKYRLEDDEPTLLSTSGKTAFSQLAAIHKDRATVPNLLPMWIKPVMKGQSIEIEFPDNMPDLDGSQPL